MWRTWAAREIYQIIKALHPGDRLLLYCKRGHSRSAWVCTIMVSVILDIPLMEASCGALAMWGE